MIFGFRTLPSSLTTSPGSRTNSKSTLWSLDKYVNFCQLQMGYDTDLFLKVEDWAICQICHDVLERPVFSGCGSEHLFCLVCINATPVYAGCPSCRGMGPPGGRKESAFANRLIQNFAVKCEMFSSGCSWTGPLSNLEGHKISCDYKPHPCPKHNDGCAFTGPAPALEKHRDSECLYVSVNCSRACGIAYKRIDEKKHEEVCTAWPCSVEGCKTKTTKKFLKQHEGGCRAQAAQLKKAKAKLKNVKSELRRKRKTDAKRAEKEKNAAGSEEDEGEEGANLIPTAHDTPPKTSTNSKKTVSEPQQASSPAQEKETKGGDGDQEMKAAPEEATSPPKKRKRGKKARGKAKENAAPSGAGVKK